MCVGIQGEVCGEVPQHAAGRLDIHSVLKGDGSDGVAEVVASDLGDDCSFEDSFQYVMYIDRGDRADIGGGDHIDVMGLTRLFPKNFCRLL